MGTSVESVHCHACNSYDFEPVVYCDRCIEEGVVE